MLLGKTIGQRRICRLETLLDVYRETQPKSLDAAVRYHNAQQFHKEYGFGDPLYDPECLLIDLLTALRHFVRHKHQCEHTLLWNQPHVDLVSSPELNGFVEDLRKFADEHELCWDSALDWSLMHFEAEVDEETHVS